MGVFHLLNFFFGGIYSFHERHRSISSQVQKKKRKYCHSFLVSIQILHYEFLGPIPLSEWGPPMEKLIYLIMTRERDQFTVLYADQCEKTEAKDFFVKNPKFKCWISNAGSEENLYLAIYPMSEQGMADRMRILEKIILRFIPPCNEGTVPSRESSLSVEKKNLGAYQKERTEEKGIPSFVDPNKDPMYYIRRYLHEPKYKDWFDRNYPEYKIYEAVGISKYEFDSVLNTLEDEPQSTHSFKIEEPELEKQKESFDKSKINELKSTEEIPKNNFQEYKQKQTHERESEESKEISMNCPCCGSPMKKEKELENSFLMKCTECGISDTRLKS